ncbi:MAG: hypothetical protein AB1726_12980 [Planctomycetota bacterium]
MGPRVGEKGVGFGATRGADRGDGDRRRQAAVQAFCSGVLVTCVLASLGPQGTAGGPGAPPRAAFAAPVALPRAGLEGERGEPPAVETLSAGGSGRPAARLLARILRPLVRGFAAARVAPPEAAPAAGDPFPLELWEERPEAPIAGGPLLDAGEGMPDAGAADSTAGRLSAEFLRAFAAVRYAPTPMIAVDPDTGAVLVGLTWRR